jgi:hypothetical protein
MKKSMIATAAAAALSLSSVGAAQAPVRAEVAPASEEAKGEELFGGQLLLTLLLALIAAGAAWWIIDNEEPVSD